MYKLITTIPRKFAKIPTKKNPIYLPGFRILERTLQNRFLVILVRSPGNAFFQWNWFLCSNSLIFAIQNFQTNKLVWKTFHILYFRQFSSTLCRTDFYAKLNNTNWKNQFEKIYNLFCKHADQFKIHFKLICIKCMEKYVKYESMQHYCIRFICYQINYANNLQWFVFGFKKPF